MTLAPMLASLAHFGDAISAAVALSSARLAHSGMSGSPLRTMHREITLRSAYGLGHWAETYAFFVK
jgi:hypothetical protein